MSDSELQLLRDKIDKIDLEIQQLLNDRASCAQQVALVKQAVHANHGGDNPVFYRPEREAQVLRRVVERNQGPLDAKKVAHIFREIMSACLALEKPLEVAYLGPAGTFTQAATLKHFGHAIQTCPLMSVAQIFNQVENKVYDYGVVPLENSTEGMVTHTLDRFVHSPLKICGEVELPITLHLLVSPNSEKNKIKSINAHQQALAQARQWLDGHWPGVEAVAVSSNAEAARQAAEDESVAAIAGDLAAEQYGLVKLADNIQDYANNTTRFLVIGREEVTESGKDKTSLVISTRNEPGALLHLLEPFQRAGINLTRIDTRPSRTENWAYLFFIEFEGHYSDVLIEPILVELRESAHYVKILGSYPVALT